MTSVDVEVEIDLNDLETSDLIRELEERDYVVMFCDDIDLALADDLSLTEELEKRGYAVSSDDEFDVLYDLKRELQYFGEAAVLPMLKRAFERFAI